MADNDNITVTQDFVVALPHLILHPFGAASGTEQLLEGSRAAIDLQEAAISNPRYGEIHERVLLGRYQEIRMLLFLGKDVFRWIEQCLDLLSRSEVVCVLLFVLFFLLGGR